MTDFQDYISFIPGVIPPEAQGQDLWFVFYNDKLLLIKDEQSVILPARLQIQKLLTDINSSYYLGSLRGIHCYCAEITKLPSNIDNLEVMDLRSAGLLMSGDLFLISGKAVQIINWDKTHKYCGRCGSATETKADERAKVCPKCGLMCFPKICPAIIVAVTKGEEILLAHNHRFPDNLYSVVAGFVEPSETFEDCVKREVLEETGILVKNIKYFSSQSWPFPNSLMIGFTAEYAGGDVKADGVEIAHADWFSVDKLPTLPGKLSVARKLIDNFIEKMNGNKS